MNESISNKEWSKTLHNHTFGFFSRWDLTSDFVTRVHGKITVSFGSLVLPTHIGCESVCGTHICASKED